MSIEHAHGKRRTATPTTPSRDKALDAIKFERLLRTARGFDDYYDLQTEFVLLVCGRLGLRRGELAHMREAWIDWRQRRIVIPPHDRCTSGRDGGVCGTCRQLAEQHVRHADEDLVVEDVLGEWWRPKTEAAAREIPFAPFPRVEIVIEEFFDRFSEWPHSCQAVNRRLDTVIDETPGLLRSDTTVHGLRATAATFHAGRGLNVFSLQQLMGWADLQTARKYIASNPDNTERALHLSQSG